MATTYSVLMEEPQLPAKSTTNVQEGGGGAEEDAAVGTYKQHMRRAQRTELIRKQQRAATFAAFVAFGLASWIMTNASYIELGVFLQELPEKYSIYAYSIFALQSANVYPLLYMALNDRGQLVKQSTVIWWLLATGILGAVLMSLLWRQTASVFGDQHSVAMLVLTHVGGLVSATSTVVFYPYVAMFPSIFTSGLSTGEGLSGSIAALLGVVQAPYDPSAMRFSVTVFYLLCAFIMVISLIGFAFLQCHPWATHAKHMADGDDARNLKAHMDEEAPLVHAAAPENGGRSISTSNGNDTTQPQTRRAILRSVWQLLACQLILAAFSFGVVPSIMSYVYKKFAPVDDMENATSRYQTVANIASLVLDPIARVSTSWWRFYYVRALTVVLVVIASMLLSFSLTSKPFLSGDSFPNGYLLPLLSHIGYFGLYAYTQTMVFLTLKRSSQQYDGEYARVVYQWSGFCTQIGAFAGTLVIFPLVFFNEKLFIE
uniref:Nodulin-like domain-containing protein n=1 Tax=Globisporangium ultimum (strain ATCC 200006 / CBS 805.95 / DAOM BR144) TaxID=431595 RepID=K3WXK6_GLOUD